MSDPKQPETSQQADKPTLDPQQVATMAAAIEQALFKPKVAAQLSGIIAQGYRRGVKEARIEAKREAEAAKARQEALARGEDPDTKPAPKQEVPDDLGMGAIVEEAPAQQPAGGGLDDLAAAVQGSDFVSRTRRGGGKGGRG